MRIKRYENSTCAHLEADGRGGEGYVYCSLTNQRCVGLEPIKDTSTHCMDQSIVFRCPMRNLDFKLFLGRNISDLIKSANTSISK